MFGAALGPDFMSGITGDKGTLGNLEHLPQPKGAVIFSYLLDVLLPFLSSKNIQKSRCLWKISWFSSIYQKSVIKTILKTKQNTALESDQVLVSSIWVLAIRKVAGILYFHCSQLNVALFSLQMTNRSVDFIIPRTQEMFYFWRLCYYFW